MKIYRFSTSLIFADTSQNKYLVKTGCCSLSQQRLLLTQAWNIVNIFGVICQKIDP